MVMENYATATSSPSASLSSTNSSLSSVSSYSAQEDDSEEIDELAYRSQKLSNLLRENLNKTERRTKLLDVVKRRAWLLSEHVGELEQQTRKARDAVGRRTFARRLVLFGAFVSSLVLLGLGVNHATSPDEMRDD